VKLAWIVYGPLHQRTGGTIYDALVVAGLRRDGVTVRVNSLVPPGPSPAGASHGHGRRRRRTAPVRGHAELVRALAADRPEILVGDELCFPHLAFALPRCTFARRVVLVHHLTCWEAELRGGRRARARFLEAITLRHADSVIATSVTTRDRLVRDGHRGPIHVVTPGADRLDRVPRAPLDVARPCEILFVGAIIARKRVVELVHAFAESAAKDARLTLAGSRDRDPTYAEQVDRTVAGVGIADRVRAIGEVDDAELGALLARADLLVLPSSLEGYGIAATEAVRAGVPVVAARTPGLVEALSACPDAAIFFERRDELARALALVTGDARARAELSAAAASAAPQMPTWTGCIESFRAALSIPPEAPACRGARSGSAR
jgi:glycosyltransferase involved in cell wall biosynthesis